MDNNVEQQMDVVEKEAKLEPREIEGLDEFLMQETIGGGKTSVPALYLNEPDREFLLTHNKSLWKDHNREDSDVTFGISIADMKKIRELLQAGKEVPPMLIDQIVANNDQGRTNLEVITRRVREHNAQRVLDFYLKQGNMDDLPLSQYSPTNDEIRQLTIGVAIPAKAA